jgi:hypothetical protein
MPSPATNLASILTNLKTAIVGSIVVHLPQIPFLWFIFGRLGRTSQRFERLFAQWQNGTLPKRRAPRPGRTRAARPAPPFRFPAGRAWLVARHGYKIAAYASQFRHWIATTPELAEFLAAAPQARRLLNPLCRMLGATLPPVPAPVPPPPVAAPPHPEPAMSPAPLTAHPPPRPCPAEPEPSNPASPSPPEVFSPA